MKQKATDVKDVKEKTVFEEEGLHLLQPQVNSGTENHHMLSSVPQECVTRRRQWAMRRRKTIVEVKKMVMNDLKFQGERIQQNSHPFLLWSAWSVVPFFFVQCTFSKTHVSVFVDVIHNDFQKVISFCGTILKLKCCGAV